MTNNRKKLLITGSDGFLGVRTAAYFRGKLAEAYEVAAYGRRALDITDEKAVAAVFRKEQPDWALHMAALSDVGYCQNHPQESEKVNVNGSRNVAESCLACGAKLVYMSSDQVYNGCSDRGALPESAVLSPQNVYAVHKLAAEEAVRCLLPDAVGLRLTWMYDRLDSPYRMNRNLLTRLKEAQETGIPVRASVYELRGITNVWEVIRRLPACFGLPGGIYNYGSENALSFYETVRAFARICGYDADAVVEKDLHFTRNLSMSLSRLREYGMDFPASVENCV
jgi:dTDP-4-dehydrorhamnose reductase